MHADQRQCGKGEVGQGELQNHEDQAALLQSPLRALLGTSQAARVPSQGLCKRFGQAARTASSQTPPLSPLSPRELASGDDDVKAKLKPQNMSLNISMREILRIVHSLLVHCVTDEW